MPPYPETPQAMVDLLESIFQTHCPPWVKCKQLLLTLFNTEELCGIVTEARKWLQTQAPAGHLPGEARAGEASPDGEPRWDPKTEEGRSRLQRCRLAFLQGIRAGAKKPTNMTKTSKVLQKWGESLADFYESLRGLQSLHSGGP